MMKKHYTYPEAAEITVAPGNIMVLSDPEGPASFEGNWETGEELEL